MTNPTCGYMVTNTRYRKVRCARKATMVSKFGGTTRYFCTKHGKTYPEAERIVSDDPNGADE